MMDFACFRNKLQHLCNCSCLKLSCFCRSTWLLLLCLYRYIVFRVNPLTLKVCYFISVSLVGFWVLFSLTPRSHHFRPRNLDLFFTSVSATTVSSMSTVEMEVFSDGQLVVLAILMFVSGKVFTSMVGLHLVRSKLWRSRENQCQVNSSGTNGLGSPTDSLNEVELGTKVAAMADPARSRSHFDISQGAIMTLDRENLKLDSIRFLGTVVLGYFLVIHVVGVVSVMVYIVATSSAKDVLTRKGLQTFTYSVFTTVSTFASGGFIPTNESMMVFRKNSGLLLILLPQVLLGNTLFPSCLRFSIWFIGKFVKKGEARFLLRNTEEIGYLHLLPGLHSSLLATTVSGFILVQFVLFCSMEWNSAALGGLNSYQKVIGALFQTVNARHSGETIVDLSTIAPAILVVFIVMMTPHPNIPSPPPDVAQLTFTTTHRDDLATITASGDLASTAIDDELASIVKGTITDPLNPRFNGGKLALG
ncbi:hypothetical protein RJ639_005123 [Escallonia herrerae]|uniref:Uncharacterized protein n=1 Tax=Escallonia herrerae TaxID=1293975 RepID=A0AA88W2A2_9ASTE|nr:hypothetical protein RJ639_005123 [Escallonia herrerae]